MVISYGAEWANGDQETVITQANSDVKFPVWPLPLTIFTY